MTPLRQRMIEDLRVRGLSQNTIDSYVEERAFKRQAAGARASDRRHYVSIAVHHTAHRRLTTRLQVPRRGARGSFWLGDFHNTMRNQPLTGVRHHGA